MRLRHLLGAVLLILIVVAVGFALALAGGPVETPDAGVLVIGQCCEAECPHASPLCEAADVEANEDIRLQAAAPAESHYRNMWNALALTRHRAFATLQAACGNEDTSGHLPAECATGRFSGACT